MFLYIHVFAIITCSFRLMDSVIIVIKDLDGFSGRISVMAWAAAEISQTMNNIITMLLLDEGRKKRETNKC